MCSRVIRKNIFFSETKSELTPGAIVLGELKYQFSDFYLEKWPFAGTFWCSKDLQGENSRNPFLVITFEWRVLLTEEQRVCLNYILQDLSRDTPLDYIWSAQICILGHFLLFAINQRIAPVHTWYFALKLKELSLSKNLTIAVAPEILVPQQLLGLPFGESVMAECLVEVGIMQSFKVYPVSKSG